MKKLLKVSEAAAKTYGVMVPNADALPFINGAGGQDWQCPACDAVLASAIPLDELKKYVNAAIECPKCNTVSTWELKN